MSNTVKRLLRVVLVASDYVVVDDGGNNRTIYMKTDGITANQRIETDIEEERRIEPKETSKKEVKNGDRKTRPSTVE